LRELALHILDIAENSVTAGASTIDISVQESISEDRLSITIADNGKGMDEITLARITDPFVTSRTTRRVGLGIPLLKAAAEACHGGLTLISKPGQGASLAVEFQRSHIDRMPLGDLAGTILTLVVGYPAVRWRFKYRLEQEEFFFDDEPIKKELDGLPLTEPAILAFIREMLSDGIGSVQKTAANTQKRTFKQQEESNVSHQIP
jgi:hypothetical protein